MKSDPSLGRAKAVRCTMLMLAARPRASGDIIREFTLRARLRTSLKLKPERIAVRLLYPCTSIKEYCYHPHGVRPPHVHHAQHPIVPFRNAPKGAQHAWPKRVRFDKFRTADSALQPFLPDIAFSQHFPGVARQFNAISIQS